jgi:hypothetical protein
VYIFAMAFSARFGALIAAVTIGLAGCGGSSTTKTVAATTTTDAASQTTTTHGKGSPSRAHTRKQQATTASYHPSGTPATSTAPNWVHTTGTPDRTTVPGTSAFPKYVGPSPLLCLSLVGLDRARATLEPYAWDANVPGTREHDSNAIVILSGPYKSAAVAQRYAHSLLVVELAQSGGRWVASASVRSHLGGQVKRAARCMGSG